MSNDVLPGFMACPDCDGTGSIADGRRIPASFFQPAEVDSHGCERCGGTGEALDPETDAVDLDLTLRLARVARKAARLASNSLKRMSASQGWEILMARSKARQAKTAAPRRVRELVEDEGWSRKEARALVASGF